jgi:hypothetical protein
MSNDGVPLRTKKDGTLKMPCGGSVNEIGYLGTSSYDGDSNQGITHVTLYVECTCEHRQHELDIVHFEDEDGGEVKIKLKNPINKGEQP